MKETYNILAFDGGGILGVVTAVWLRELARRHPGFLAEIDMFAGTSMGSANALAVATGMDLDEVVRIYTHDGPKLFSERYQPPGLGGKVLRFLTKTLGWKWLQALEGLFYPKWANTGLERELGRYFGEQRLGDVDSDVSILTTKLWSSFSGADRDKGFVKPVVIDNIGDTSRSLLIREAVLRSMSAPVFFPSHDGFVDGGVFAVNPTMGALGRAVEKRTEIDRVRVLSLGCGITPDGIENDGSLAWGALHWGLKFPGASTSAVGEFDAEQAGALLGDGRYCRLNAVLPKQYPLDDYHQVAELIAFAERRFDSAEFKKASEFTATHFA